MRNLALLILLAGLTKPLFAVDHKTVKELEVLTASAHRTPDAHLAKQLFALQLTERLTTARLTRLKAELPGEQSRTALLAIADASAFLNLPASDVPVAAAPDRFVQAALLARTLRYVKNAIPRLPDFLATQRTIHFADGPANGSAPVSGKHYDQGLHLVDKSVGTVQIVAGREELDAGREQQGDREPTVKKLTVVGVFGPVFTVVLNDVLAGDPAWSRWEQGPGGPMAVFRYDVPEGKSHYAVQVPGEESLLKSNSPYHGEIAVDPASGAVLRLTLIADRKPETPVAKAQILVEYGPIEIGGKAYICPLRSVVLSLARSVDLMHDVYKFSQAVNLPYQLELNDVEFRQYHLFHSEMRILTGDNPGADRNSQAPATSPNR